MHLEPDPEGVCDGVVGVVGEQAGHARVHHVGQKLQPVSLSVNSGVRFRKQIEIEQAVHARVCHVCKQL